MPIVRFQLVYWISALPCLAACLLDLCLTPPPLLRIILTVTGFRKMLFICSLLMSELSDYYQVWWLESTLSRSVRKFPGSFIRITRRLILKQLSMFGIFTRLQFEVIIIMQELQEILAGMFR